MLWGVFWSLVIAQFLSWQIVIFPEEAGLSSYETDHSENAFSDSTSLKYYEGTQIALLWQFGRPLCFLEANHVFFMAWIPLQSESVTALHRSVSDTICGTPGIILQLRKWILFNSATCQQSFWIHSCWPNGWGDNKYKLQLLHWNSI